MKCFPNALVLPLALALLAGTSSAQCFDWKGGLAYASDGLPAAGQFNALAVHDDGTGSSLYVGGSFAQLAGVSGTYKVARWDGVSWHAAASGATWLGANEAVTALCSFDDGSGPALYAGGWNATSPTGNEHSSLARWDGSSWQVLGMNFGIVKALAVFDDGSGPALYGAGQFHENGAFYPVAKWVGTTWVALVSGLQLSSSSASSLAVYDDGSGPALHAANIYTTDNAIRGVAKWTGGTWLPVGAAFASSFGPEVLSLLVHDDGNGAALYAAGRFDSVGGVAMKNAARWDGASWSSVGTGTDYPIHALASYDSGSGPELYAGRPFTHPGGAPPDAIAKWSQGSWSQVGAGIIQVEFDGASVEALAVFDAGSGPQLFAAGKFAGAGDQAANGFASWNGSAWSTSGGTGQGADATVRVMKVLDDGHGPGLWAAGDFFAAGRTAARRVARWNGTGWHAIVGSSLYPPRNVRALAALHVSGGVDVYAGGGDFWNYTLTRATPQGWVIVPSAPNNTIWAMENFDDGGGTKLFVGGDFNVAGSAYLGGIGRFDGANWSPLSSGMDGGVRALAVFDEGTEPTLFAGGAFTNAGGVPANYVARWNGSSWSALGGGMNGSVLALRVFDDGSGPALYAGGAFTLADGQPANHIARWNGTSWSALGSGTDAQVNALGVFDDGSGATLCAGGEFTSAGGVSAKRVAKWNGSSWSVLGSGVGNSVYALASFDDGTSGGGDLFVGGAFTTAGALASAHIAIWEGCGGTNQTFCFGDGSLTACPCANSGLPGHGCRNSAASRGAELTPSGTSIPDALQLSVAFEPSTALSIFLQGDAQIPAGTFFGDGLRCTGGNLKRLYAKNASGGLVSAPTGADLPVSLRSAALGDVIPPGATRYYQVYYRDPDPSFCPAPSGATFNVSNGARILW